MQTTTPPPEYEAITTALQYLDENNVEVSAAVRLKVYALTVKAGDELTELNRRYHDEISEALTTYFEGGAVTGPRNRFRIATTELFYDAFYKGYSDGGGKPPLPPEALQWLEARINEEYGFIDALMGQIKELRADTAFDFFEFVVAKADGYTQTLRDIYNKGKLYALRNTMLTFAGDDGSAQHVCQSINGTCVRLKGKRHRASWWIAHDLMPYRGNRNYDCGGWNCQHYLVDDEGKQVTI